MNYIIAVYIVFSNDQTNILTARLYMHDQYLLACEIYTRSEVRDGLHNITYKGMIPKSLTPTDQSCIDI